MGLSLFLAMIGFAFAALGVLLLLLRKNKKIAIASLIVGAFFIVVPFSLIYFLLD
jgi:uncharacterized membrane protein YedE/YeeE